MKTKEQTAVKTKNQIKIAFLLLWAGMAGLLIFVGITLENITDTGHHVALILAGMIIGAGLNRVWRW